MDESFPNELDGTCIMDFGTECPMREDAFIQGQIAWIVLFFMNMIPMWQSYRNTRDYYSRSEGREKKPDAIFKVNALILTVGIGTLLIELASKRNQSEQYTYWTPSSSWGSA